MESVLGDGAEAVVVARDGDAVKLRKEKRYRHPDIDVRLRSTRTRQEAGILEKLHRLGFPSPALRAMDDRAAEIRMELLSRREGQGLARRELRLEPPRGTARRARGAAAPERHHPWRPHHLEHAPNREEAAPHRLRPGIL